MTSLANRGRNGSEAPSPHPFSKDFRWIDAPRAGMRRLSPGQIDAFNEAGFFVYRDAFTADEIAEVTAAIDPLEKETSDFVEARGGRFILSQTGAITFSAHIVKRSPVLARFAAHPAIKDICHDLIGDDVRLYWDQSVYKKAEMPQEFPWHQDNGYTFIEPQQYLTLWIPLVDVDEQNGCPWIAPGVHKRGTLEHWLTGIGLKCMEDVPDAVCVPGKAGDVIAFSSLAPHRTGPNLKTGSVRKAYILQYAPDGAYTVRSGVKALQNDAARQFKILES